MKANFKNFEISSEFTGSKKAMWGDADPKYNIPENWNHHKVTVKNTDLNVETSFDFWGSVVSPVLTTEYDVLNAFYCFVGDAISGWMSFEDFCGEFGYDTDSRRAEKVWRACVESFKSLQGICEDDFYDMVNELSEIAG